MVLARWAKPRIRNALIEYLLINSRTAYFLVSKRRLVSDARNFLVYVVGRYSAGSEAHILWGVGIRNQTVALDICTRLNACGMPTLDISRIEAAQVLFCGQDSKQHPRFTQSPPLHLCVETISASELDCPELQF